MSRSSPAPRGSRRHIIRWPVSDRPPHDGWHFTSFVVTDRGPNSAARWRSSVPLARPLSPPDLNPLSVLRLIRQVLRELRVILCQTFGANVGSNRDIRNFCPIVVIFSTGLFTLGTTSNYLDACFAQDVRHSVPFPRAEKRFHHGKRHFSTVQVGFGQCRGWRRGDLTSDLCTLRAFLTERILQSLRVDCRKCSHRWCTLRSKNVAPTR